MSPSSGGPAERAGVRKGDRLIWLDGATVSEVSHSAISKMVRLKKMYFSVHYTVNVCCCNTLLEAVNIRMNMKMT